MADVDWVRARFECSLPKIFERLFLGAQSDVDARNELAKGAEAVTFEVYRLRDDANRFQVTRSGSAIRKVTFGLTSGGITVEGDGSNFVATPGYNSTADCTLTVEDQELELWKVRRKALENLFFGDAAKPPVAMRATKRQ